MEVGEVGDPGERLPADLDEARFRGRIVGAGPGGCEAAERIVDQRPAEREVRGEAERIERLQLEDVFGVDRVGIADEGLDLGDGEAARPDGDRRDRRWSLHRRHVLGRDGIDDSRQFNVPFATGLQPFKGPFTEERR